MADLEALKEEYLDHMMNPRNYGKIENEDAKGIGQNPMNNEMVEIYLRLDGDVIEEIKFMAIGCMSTIVTGSIFTDMLVGETIQEGESVAEEFLKNLVNAPEEQRACGEMVAKAFLAALVNLQHRRAGKEEASYTLIISENCGVEGEDGK
jgi:nitrogen fixation NifU-like protein